MTWHQIRNSCGKEPLSKISCIQTGSSLGLIRPVPLSSCVRSMNRSSSRSSLVPIHSDCAKRKDPVFLATDTDSAELIKHASNSFLAMKISFINMVANLCEVVGADVTKVAQGMGLDPRIGPAFLNPGIGFGGFCFPKDVQAFIRIAEKSGCDFSLLKEVEKINQRRVEHFIEKIRKELWVVRGKEDRGLGSGVQAKYRRRSLCSVDRAGEVTAGRGCGA